MACLLALVVGERASACHPVSLFFLFFFLFLACLVCCSSSLPGFFVLALGSMFWGLIVLLRRLAPFSRIKYRFDCIDGYPSVRFVFVAASRYQSEFIDRRPR